ncbi:helix-hairpin-helix motif protein [Flavobacterium succinicans]|uniref:Helix-hairpin-helix motif protein n=1 Tax=Flavobacterium succinicans TaxID=29536 RepID=A0A199XNI7_9FLAO|nr:helix-hairpin-helix motif protein [Flavobacterium succinicans]
MFKRFSFYLKFTNSQRKGLLVLFGSIIILQMFYWFIEDSAKNSIPLAGKDWLSLQKKMDELKTEKKKKFAFYPFNPNFITDYKGYKLGMSVEEIDRLHAFRKTNRYVNSAEEFQNVTGVSDTLLNKIAPFFKFPDWVNAKSRNETKSNVFLNKREKKKVVKLDINFATKEDLIKVYGVGEVIANRIIAQRNSLKGFVAMEQLNEVWGLSPEVIENINTQFYVSKLPQLELIDINNASLKELSQFFYFKYTLAKQILIYRSMNGDFKNIEDLSKIKGFPVDKAKIIALYLKF